MKTKDLIEETLRFDPLGKALEETGSYTSGPGLSLGMDYAHARSAQLERLMLETKDTYRGMPFEDFGNIAKDVGFSLVLKATFQKYNKDQHFNIYWHYDYNILMPVTSIRWEHDKDIRLNGGHFYYQHQSNHFWQEDRRWPYSSGGFEHIDDYAKVAVWVGNHDATNGCLRYYINGLLECGKFIEWQHKGFVHLSHYGDKENNNTDYWISQLPSNIQKVVLKGMRKR